VRLSKCLSIAFGCVGLVGCAAGSDIDYHLFYVGVSDAATTEPAPIATDAGLQIEPQSSPVPSQDSGAPAPLPTRTNDSGIYMEPYDSGAGAFDAGVGFDATPEGFDSGSATCTLTLSTGIPACDTCISAGCCGVDQQCGNDQDCLAFAECVSECETPGSSDAGDGGSCVSSCETEYPTGAGLLSSLDSCIEAECGAECGAP